MLLDPGTWTLAQRAEEILALVGDDLAGSCSAETHEAALELTTSPHATVGGAIAELGRLRARLARDARRLGLATATAGMHPGHMAEDAQVPAAGRYRVVHATMRGIARREPTFALHVHIGVADAESAIRLLNSLRAHLPLFLALSASSPLWRGRATGLASNRTILFQAFPRTGLPRRFDDTPTGSTPSTCSWTPVRSRSRPSSGGTCGHSPASAPSRFASWTPSRASRRRPRSARSSSPCAGWSSRRASRRASSSTPRRRSPRTASSPPATA